MKDIKKEMKMMILFLLLEFNLNKLYETGKIRNWLASQMQKDIESVINQQKANEWYPFDTYTF